jgi:hypothetical protein
MAYTEKHCKLAEKHFKAEYFWYQELAKPAAKPLIKKRI